MTSRRHRRQRDGGKTRPSGRNLAVRIHSARRRKSSSTRWLQRQLNDPYVQAAKNDGYRSRSAFKLLQLDEKFGFLVKGQTAVDLGAAPGGWTQVLAKHLGPDGTILAVDRTEIAPIGGCKTLVGDVTELKTKKAILELLKGPVNIVLSDMSPSTIGHRSTDHIRSVTLAEAAMNLAYCILASGGVFVTKVWQGGSEHNLLVDLKRDFAQVHHFKPKASRSDSAEMYLVARGYRGHTQHQNPVEG